MTVMPFHLQSIALFSKLAEESFASLLQCSKKVFYKKGHIFLKTHDIAQFFFYVCEGWVKLFKETKEGDEIIIDVLTNTHYFGESFLFEENKEHYNAQAIEDLEIIMIPLASLKSLIAKDRSLALNFLQSTLAKQQTAHLEIERLSSQNAFQRVACFILRLAATNQEKKAVVLRFPYDKTLLASRLGMRPETFSRALSKLHQHYGVEVKNDVIHVNNIDALIRLVCQQCSQTYPCKDK